MYHFMQVFYKMLVRHKCFLRPALSEKFQVSFQAGYKNIHVSSTDFYHFYYLLSFLLQSIR